MKEIREIIAEQIKKMGDSIGKYAEAAVSKEVMVDSDKAMNEPDPIKRAPLIKEAIDRLDILTDEVTRQPIMRDCGYNCQNMFKEFMEEAKARRSKFKTEEEFLEYELNPPPGTGSRFERDGDIIYNYYTPRRYGEGMRCYCYLIGGLPDNIKASPTFCQCSRAWVEKYWEGALGRTVRVELGETAISSGSDECKFIVHLK